MGVSKNRGTPKSSILIGFSIINHPFWGTPIFGNTHVEYFKNKDLPTECVFFENTRTQKVGVAKNAREGGGEDVWTLDGWMLKLTSIGKKRQKCSIGRRMGFLGGGSTTRYIEYTGVEIHDTASKKGG